MSHSHSHSHSNLNSNSNSHSHSNNINNNNNNNNSENKDFDEDDYSGSGDDHCMCDDDKEELEHYQLIVSTLLNYSQYALHWVKDMKDFYHHKLSQLERELLPNYNNKMDALARAVLTNSQLLKTIGNEHCNIFSMEPGHDNGSAGGSSGSEGKGNKNAQEIDPRNLDHIKIDYFLMDQLKSTIRQLVREWSAEGKFERDQAFEPIKNQLLEIYGSIPFEERSKIKVYTPGAGLGRLCLEIASLGFSSQGIEYSFMMLIVSNFMLNKVEKINQFKIHPYIHQTVNVLRDIDQLRFVQIPDVLSTDLLPKNPSSDFEFSMAAGDFTKNIQENSFDCICTCFFIDTAVNILEYVECISKLLKPGGHWINFGPLLYHHSKKKDSIELSYEQLRYLISKMNFNIVKEEIRDAEYCSNQKSLLRSIYKCQFFVAINNKQ